MKLAIVPVALRLSGYIMYPLGLLITNKYSSSYNILISTASGWKSRCSKLLISIVK